MQRAPVLRSFRGEMLRLLGLAGFHRPLLCRPDEKVSFLPGSSLQGYFFPPTTPKDLGGQDLDYKWQSVEFLNLTCKAVCAVVSSDECGVRNENTAYRAVRRWWMESKNSPAFQLAAASPKAAPSPPKKPVITSPSAVSAAAISLLASVRFHHMTADFLLDVVKYDQAFLCGPPEMHEPVLDMLCQSTREAIEYHACSSKRRQVHPEAAKHMFSRRPASIKQAGQGPPPFTWKVEGVSRMIEGRYIFSPSFYLDGYWFRLQAGRIRWERADGFAFALFLSLVFLFCAESCYCC